MFNVMVTAGDNAWEEGAYVWDRSRVLEHTADDIRAPLLALTPAVLEELAKLPTLFMYEQSADGVPRIGHIRRIQQRGSDIRVIFEFDDSVPPLTDEALQELRWDLQLADFEFSRTHWAVKDGDLLAILREHGLIGAVAAEAPAVEPEPVAPAVEVPAAPAAPAASAPAASEPAPAATESAPAAPAADGSAPAAPAPTQ